MRIRNPRAWAAAAVLLLGLACSLDDNSAAVFVVVQSDAPVVLRGDKVVLQARAYRLVGVDTVEIKNIRFAWSSSNQTIATVVGDDYGGAELTGVNGGLVDVSATAVAFEASSVGYFQMRVSNFIEIDSVRPAAVKWGEKVALYGVGVRNVLIADLGTALFPDTLTFQGDPQGLGRMEFWVPPPARTSQLFGVGPGVFFTVPETTAVDTVDLYEYNDTIPSLINLDGPGPYPTQIPSLLFFNPALAFEEPDRTATIAFDWYRFNRTDVSRPITFVLRPQGISDSSGLFLVLGDSIRWAAGHTVPIPTWFMTTTGQFGCPRGTIDVAGQRPESLIVALRRRPLYTPGQTGIHLLALYSQPQRYAITIVDGYLTSDPRIAPDRFEENDICTFADSNFAVPATRIDVTNNLFSVFQDSALTIDNPHEMDWYRFRVTAPGLADSTMIKIRGRPFPGPVMIDRSDIDLYVVRAADFAFMGFGSAKGSGDSLRLLLPTGEYYLAAFDYAGEATRYSLCIKVTFNCNPLVTAAEAGAQASFDGVTRTGSARKRDPVVRPASRTWPLGRP